MCTQYPNRCCYKEHYITFAELGLDNIVIEPRYFNAGLCLGECGKLWMEQHHHSLLMPDEHLCCSPSKMRDLKVLVRDRGGADVLVLPNIVLTECGCK